VSKKKKWTIIGTSIVMLYLLISWFFPFHFYSMIKTFTFSPEKKIVENYNNYLKDFKNRNEIEKIYEDYNINLEKIMRMYEQDWLISKNEKSIHIDDIDYILYAIRYGKRHLLDLFNSEYISDEADRYLISVIGDLDFIEQSLYDLKYNSKNRYWLSKRLNSLQDSFYRNLQSFDMFLYMAFKK